MSVSHKFIWLFLAIFTCSVQSRQISPNSVNSDKVLSDGELVFAQTVSKWWTHHEFCVTSEIAENCYHKNWKLCRHGDRNVYKLYPNDPWKDEIHWPGGYAQLTNVSVFQRRSAQWMRCVAPTIIFSWFDRWESNGIMNWVNISVIDTQVSLAMVTIHPRKSTFNHRFVGLSQFSWMISNVADFFGDLRIWIVSWWVPKWT